MKVWLVGNLPPPVHGVSEFNRALCEHFDREQIPYRAFPVGTRDALASVGRPTASKVLSDAAALARIALHAASQPREGTVVYFTASQKGAVILRDRLLVEIARRFAIPLVAHIHGCEWLETFRKGGRRARVMRETLQACSTVICLGATYAARLADELGVNTAGINNGVVDLAAGAPARRAAAGQRVELLFLSNLMRAKGLWVAARSTELLRDRGYDVRLRCAGAWKTAEEERAFRSDFAGSLSTGLIEMVGFAGPTEKRDLLATSQMMLLPIVNPFEGQPLALIEAMAAGVVPVTTRPDSIADLMTFDGGEVVANPGHLLAEGVASTCANLLSNQDERERLAQRCRSHYREHLTVASCNSSVVGVLRSAVERSAAVGHGRRP